MTTPMPSRQSVRETFEMLMGRTVKATDGDRVTYDLLTGPISVGTIIDDADRLVAIVAADLPLTVYAGSCLGLMPAGGAEESVAEKELSDMVCDNFYEVLNVLSSVFNVDGAPHVRLGEVHTNPDLLPPHAVVAVKSLTRRDDLSLDIAGYGTGNLSIVLCDD